SNRHVVHGQLLVRISSHASFSCRWPALIRGRSHPTRCASGTWLAAHSAAPCVHLVTRKLFVSLAGADSRALAPHSLRERDLARCSQRLTMCDPLRGQLLLRRVLRQ